MTDDQKNFSNGQNAEINIEEIYKNTIQEIDRYRSHVSVSKNPVLIRQLVNALSNNTDPNVFITQIKTDPQPQESRCHTFYRLIGLPIIGPSNSLYSPGYDPDNCFKSDVLKKHYQVIQDINNNKKDLFKVMDAREKNINSFLEIFSVSNLNTKIADINASVLLLSSVSGGKIRRFNSCLENSADPFDTEIKNQSYTICTGEPTNSTNNVFLTDYKDVGGNVASKLFGRDSSGKITNPSKIGILNDSPLISRAHVLKPFMVDPRVDLTINPPKNIICAPFASSNTYNEGNNLTRSYLELICRNRFNKDNQQLNDPGISEKYHQLVDYVKSSEESLDQDLLDKIAKGVKQTTESTILENNLNIIRAMIDKLHDAISKVQETEQYYHWLPIPDPNGPEINIGTQDIKIMSSTDSDGNVTGKVDPLSTDLDRKIIELSVTLDLSNVNSSNTEVDLGGFALFGVQPIPDSSVTPGFNTRTRTFLTELVKKREEFTNNSADALRIIEIIMGEFSGLGLCDIIAMYTALWTVDKEVLVNMLDDEAFDRMYKDSTLRDNVVESRKSAGQRTLGSLEVLQKLEDKIKEIYNLMDKLLQDRFGR